MFNKYYQDELLFLREMGREFSRAYPDSAKFLAEAGSDPDVERMLEGFAFLTGRLRQKLDDELPELTHALLEMFWPHYLRPLPAMAVVQFEALPQAAREVFNVPAGSMVDSLPVDGTPCRFRTVYPVQLPPLRIETMTLEHGAPAKLRVRLRINDGVAFARLGTDRLRFHLAGESLVARSLFLCLRRYCTRIELSGDAGHDLAAGRLRIEEVGFAPDEALCPQPSTSATGFRVVQEYFTFPTKFMFLDLVGLEVATKTIQGATAELVFHFAHLPKDMPPVSSANLLLGCTPVVNLFAHDADPIRLDRLQSEYRVRPAGRDPNHYETYTIERVEGMVRGRQESRTYRPLFHISRAHDERHGFYQERKKPSVIGQGADHYLMLTDAEGGETDQETLSIALTCTNRNLPASLGVGDISVATAQTPAGVRFRNITTPTPSMSPVIAGDLHWRLLSHLSMNYLSLAQVANLRSMLDLYHMRALVDRQAQQAHQRLLEGIEAIRAAPTTRIQDGVPLRGLGIELDVVEDKIGSQGEAYLFGCVLNEFFSLYVGLNSFSRLRLRCLQRGEIHEWPARLGRKQLL